MARWSAHENARLRHLVDTGEININILTPDVLFAHTQNHFPDFVGVGKQGKATAVQRLRRLLNRIRVERDLQGIRRNEGEGAPFRPLFA
jgi:hypothetical protein